MHTRRQFLQTTFALPFADIFAAYCRNSLSAKGWDRESESLKCDFLNGTDQAITWLEQVVGPSIGRLVVKCSRDIKSSPFSVGLETLDRSMYDPEQVYKPLGELGVKWARLQTGWARTEQTPGIFDFSWLDRVVNSVIGQGVTPWFNLGYGNKLYLPEAPDTSAVGWIPIYKEDAQEAWLRYVRALTNQFRDRVKHWEIWNEPNIKNFWKPGEPSPELYAEFVMQTAKVIRNQIPEVTIIGGAVAGMPTEYLKKLLACGIAQHVDKISFHPYRPVPEDGYRETLETWKQLMRNHEYEHLQLWQGENGCPSQPGSAGALGQFNWNEVAQAKWLLRRILYDRILGLELTSYFHMVDLLQYNWGQGPTDKTNSKGLLRGKDYSPKPSYFAYQRVCSLFDHSSQRDSGLDSLVEIVPEEGAHPDSSPSAVSKRLVAPAAFVRNGAPMWCLWYGTDLMKPDVLTRLTLRIHDKELSHGDIFYLDLLSGRVFRLSNVLRETEGCLVRNIPVGDYPVVIGGLRALENLLLSS